MEGSRAPFASSALPRRALDNIITLDRARLYQVLEKLLERLQDNHEKVRAAAVTAICEAETEFPEVNRLLSSVFGLISARQPLEALFS